MTDIVDETLKLWRQSAFEWGDTDCMLSIGDYVAKCGGPDLTPDYRGRYDSEAGAHAAMQPAGGPVGIVDSSGLSRVQTPARGDIVVIDVTTPGGPPVLIGGLCTGSGVAIRRERGTAEISLRLVKLAGAWKVSKCVP